MGRIWTESPVETNSGGTYQLDLSFDATITQPPSSVDLTDGGGAPGKALLEAVAAARSGSWKELAPLLTEEERTEIENGWSETDEERIEKASYLGFSWYLDAPDAAVTVTGGQQREDGIADLDVRLANEDYTYVLSARMLQAGDRWAFVNSSFVTIE